MRKFFILYLLTQTYFVNGQVETRADSIIIKSKLRIKNHNEGVGKVLTSDIDGNATWQAIPVSPSSNWQVVGTNSARGGFNNNISDGTSNTVLIGESNNQTSGQYLYGLGWGLEPRGFGVTTLGSFNIIPTGSNTTWVASDPLFVMGNGNSNATRSNAFMVLKDGKFGINRLQSDLSTNTQKFQVSGGALIEGGLKLPTGAATGRYLRSDASGNATWAVFPTFSLSLPYSDGISSTSTAFNIINTNTSGYAFHSEGNVKLQYINEAPGRILFSTDDQGDAKWENGNCISKCSFSLTRNLKASIPSGSVQFLPFTVENFDICGASTFVNIAGDNDFHYYSAPNDGIYQFEFNGTFQTTINYALMIHKLNASNAPVTQIFSATCQGNASEVSQRYTAIVQLTAGDKIAPTIQGFNASGSMAFNNSDNPLACTFTGHIIESTDCTALKSNAK